MIETINEITGTVVDLSLKVHKAMGPGLYERAYEDCLAYELQKRDVSFKRQIPIHVQYEELKITDAFKIDLLIEDQVIVELKSVEKIHSLHETQVITYMRLAKINTGLLINFNVPLIKDGIRRFKI